MTPPPIIKHLRVIKGILFRKYKLASFLEQSLGKVATLVLNCIMMLEKLLVIKLQSRRGLIMT